MHALLQDRSAIVEHTCTATTPASTIRLQGELETVANK